MLRVTKSVAAENDLIDIWIYSFENWGAIQADKYIDQLQDAFQFLASNPLVGVNCSDIRQGYLRYPIKEHSIFYRVENGVLKVVRVLGGDMNHDEHLP